MGNWQRSISHWHQIPLLGSMIISHSKCLILAQLCTTFYMLRNLWVWPYVNNHNIVIQRHWSLKLAFSNALCHSLLSSISTLYHISLITPRMLLSNISTFGKILLTFLKTIDVMYQTILFTHWKRFTNS
jgi:hypothetical protein